MPHLLDSLSLLCAFFHVALGYCRAGLGECVKIHEDLVSGFAGVEIVDGEVEVVGSD